MEHKASTNTPLSVYHGVPEGWAKEKIIRKYISLGGTQNIEPDEAREPGAPSWLPDRYNWLQYRATLYKIADGLRVHDEACIEIAVQYIELNYFGSYSGFIRERFARLLKSKPLTLNQASRLRCHFMKLKKRREIFQEFKEYKKLENYILKEWPNV